MKKKQETQFLVDVKLIDGTLLPNCTVYTNEDNIPVTQKESIDILFTKYPWGNEVRRFRLQGKYIQAHIDPSLVKKYELVELSSEQ